MDKLKFILFSIMVLILIGLIGYWAIISMKSGSDVEMSDKIQELQNENDDLSGQIKDLEEKLRVSESKLADLAPATKVETNTPEPTPTKTITYKNQSLINDLQKLVDANVTLKLKSTGTRVGTVQKFLNVYNNTSTRIDNSFGTNMQKLVIAFQKDQGLKADGEVGPGTLSKMISWLKKQG